MRLAQRQRGEAGGEGNRLAHHLVGRAGVELEVARQRQRVGLGLLQGLADVERLEPGQVVGGGEHALRQPHQCAAALGGGEPAPLAVERRLRRGHCGVDVGGVAAGDLGQPAAI